ncbi:VTC domain-containing protein [Radiomyces spectabilis]|uniref:VTC domain-containing protein n=1 Tax=Radiomyces spectabilis TaxID=64574 RepID=UPI0022208637|nr:VTC domain-containing protein [Radiomyces spectabilis]KAI8379147.1 VTC domain-containing protein [Radiomyces spectabilis]
MKFGDHLQQEIFPPWRLSYIQYDVLKNELKTRQLDHGWNDHDEREFVRLLENELEKVYDFVTAKLGEVEARISYCERTLQTFMNNQTWSSEQNWTVMDDALTEVLFDVNDLARFSRLNYIGFQKILKKHDKWTGLQLQQDFVEQLREKPLDNQRFDVAIVFISALHDLCRVKGKPRTGNAASGGDQNAFERATAKYWIHPDNITEVKSIIMLHLPVLIFNKDKKFEPSDAAISSVYYDNEEFDLYTGRLQRDEGAEAIRFRWYGPMSSSSVFIERKTHHAAWLNGASVKDRFRLHVNEVEQFVTGELTADIYANQLVAKGTDPKMVEDSHFIAKGVETSLREKRLQPVLRAFYNRTAFQLPGDQRVRVSLDTDLTFIREDNFDGQKRRGPRQWRRPDVGIDYPFNYLDDSEILRFPYAVLETKLQTHLGQEPPQWLTKLVDSHLVHEVPRFSKYLHGACYFHRQRMPLLPWWLSEMQLDIRKPRSSNFGLTRSKSFKPLIDGKYRRAMETEERRMSIVARSLSKKSRPSVRRNVSPAGQPVEVNLLDDPLSAQGNRNQTLPRPIQLHDRQSTTGDTLVGSPLSDKHLVDRSGTPYTFYSQDGPAVSSVSSQDPLWNFSNHNNHDDPNSSTLLIAGEQPLDYGLPANKGGKKKKKKDQDLEMRELGEPVVPGTLVEDQVVVDMDGTKPKAWRRAMGDNGKPMYVKDPNNKGGVIPIKKLKVEPKVFFANERTFISWLQFCALLLTVALSLLNFGDEVSRIAGGIFLGIAALIAIYALYRFEKRAW